MALYKTEKIDIIDGSTVNPTNNVLMWLKCANLHQNYTTLSDVLADDDVMEKLFRSENASNYLVRSTTWASDITADQTAMILIGANDYCANKLLDDSTWGTAINASTYWNEVLKGLVPVMTSNTTPYGEVIYSEFNSDYPTWRAFDGNNTTIGGTGAGNNKYIGFKFNQSVDVRKALIDLWWSSSSSRSSFQAKLQASNDGSNWIDLTESLTFTDLSSHKFIEITITKNISKYTQYRVLFITPIQNDNYNFIYEIQFYGIVSKTTIYSAANDIVSFVDDEGAKIVTTDATGKGEVTIVCKPNTDITFTSSVAKDPDNLSADYKKSVQLLEDTTEVYVMPNNALYWYGYRNSIEEMSSANGWSYTNYSFINPTYNTNNVVITSSGNGIACGIGVTTAHDLNKLSFILKGTVVQSGGNYGYAMIKPSKNISATSYDSKAITSNNTEKIDITLAENKNGYPSYLTDNGASTYIYALWYEVTGEDLDDKADISAIAPNEPNVTSSQAYAAGEHFYKNGKFCTAKTAIASGATFTLNTNYVEGTVADALRIDYSISEQNTGIKWVNGDPIYCITKEVQITGSDTTFYIDLSSLNIKSILRMEAQKYVVNGSSWPVSGYYSASIYDNIQYDKNNSRIIYNRSSGTAWDGAYVSVTIYYNKAS